MFRVLHSLLVRRNLQLLCEITVNWNRQHIICVSPSTTALTEQKENKNRYKISVYTVLIRYTSCLKIMWNTSIHWRFKFQSCCSSRNSDWDIIACDNISVLTVNKLMIVKGNTTVYDVGQHKWTLFILIFPGWV